MSSSSPSPAPPKCPHLMKTVYAQIEAHPRFKELDEGTLFGYLTARNGWSWCTKENNRWVKQIWKKLYIDWETEI